MGLDMYLNAKRYLSAHDDQDKPIRNQLHTMLFGIDYDDSNISVNEVSAEVMYWRKTNSIHNWFVENVQDDEDNCKEYYVGREQLRSLLETCNKVIADNSLAESLLPTQSGCFFGAQEYDEWYFRDIHGTAERISELLTEPKWNNWEFYYRASW